MRWPTTLAILCVTSASAACPVGTKISVDNDVPGSGYSEEKPENWISHDVDACSGSYRYLSHTVGDGTRTGKAIWKPAIAVSGMYQVVTGFRATVNRTSDADYVLHDDHGGTQKLVVNQQVGDGCTTHTIGTAYCAAGGSCRLVLDGTDDSQSDSADITTFELVSCDAADAAAPSPCDAIAQNPAWEVCSESATTCAGTFSDGAGCSAYCAAAGMQCVASFGGEPGCSKEAQTPIACDAQTGHASDWCECALPPDAGSAGTGGAGGTAGAAGASAGAAGTPGSGGSWAGSGGSTTDAGAGPRGATTEDAGCACRIPGRRTPSGAIALLALGALLMRRRRPVT